MKKIVDKFINVITSMRFKVFVITFIAIIVPVIGSNFFIGKMAVNSYSKQRFEKFKTQNYILRNCILSENYMDNQDSEIVEAEMSQLATGFEGRVEVINSDYIIIKDTYNSDEGKTNISSSVIKAMTGDEVYNYYEEQEYVEYVLPIISTATDVNGNSQTKILGAMYTRYSTTAFKEFYYTILNYIVVIDLLLGVFALIMSWICSRILVKPIKSIEESIERISTGNLKANIEEKGETEVKNIIREFNQMVEIIAKQDESRQQFVSNVSHELKTPITSMKVLADSLVGQENVPEELYQEFLTDIAKEIDRENDIITDLLNLVRMDSGNDKLNISTVNINELVESTLKRLRPIAEVKNIEVVLESFRPVMADVDEVKFNMVVTNLVENAIKYNVTDGWVRVSLNADHQYFYLKVADSGIGIEDDQQEHIFERFFRVDKARARETGGTGLGLSITKNIILLHKGTVKVHSKEGEGTTFTVRIPLKYIEQ
ncbi:ATP-binding protein [Eubacterium sp.]